VAAVRTDVNGVEIHHARDALPDHDIDAVVETLAARADGGDVEGA